LKNNSATMVCPFLCVVMILSGFRGSVGVPFCSAIGGSFLRAQKRDFP